MESRSGIRHRKTEVRVLVSNSVAAAALESNDSRSQIMSRSAAPSLPQELLAKRVPTSARSAEALHEHVLPAVAAGPRSTSSARRHPAARSPPRRFPGLPRGPSVRTAPKRCQKRPL